MINKKILAASIAATFAFNAHAVIDLDDAETALVYATEAVASGGTIAANASLNTTVEIGLNLPVTATTVPFFVRYELTNAEFIGTAVVDADLVATVAAVGATTTTAIVGGGQVGDDNVVFDFDNDDVTDEEDSFAFDLDTASLKVIDNSKPVTLTYKLYANEDSLAALNGGGGEVYSQSLDIISLKSGQDVSDSFSSNANVALVAEQFTEFKADAAPAVIAEGEVASMGTIDLAFEANTLDAGSMQVDESDVYPATSSTATVAGDFSYGETWHMSVAQDCSTAASSSNTLTIAEDMASATVPSLSYTSGQTLCVEVDGDEIIPRNSDGYTVTLGDITGVSGTIGSVTYDTTAITVSYLTTFADYNQRVYILNNSSVDAPYSTTFQTEDGVTAEGGSAATGVVPAKTLLVVRATDLVTFTGATRGAAVIEIEATSTNVEATTQTINLSDASTDTVTLKVQ